MLKRTCLGALLGVTLTACAATHAEGTHDNANFNRFNALQNVALQPAVGNFSATDQVITLEKIMSDPDWMGRQPEGQYWSSDSQSVFYKQKQEGNSLRDLYQQKVTADNAEQVALSSYALVSNKDEVFNVDGSLRAYVFDGDIFVEEVSTHRVAQVTRTRSVESKPQWLNDGRLVYREGHLIFAVDLSTNINAQLLEIAFGKAPEKPKDPSTYIAKEQHKLIKFVSKTHKDSVDKFERNQAINAASHANRAPKPFYIPKKQRIVSLSLSPSGTKAILVLSDKSSFRADSDIMPNYVDQKATITPERVRERVADAKPETHTFYYLDLAKHTQHKLDLSTLPGANEDVLANVRQENAAAKGEEYESKEELRAITLRQEWYWSGSQIQWNTMGDQVAIQLEAWDNKDAWLTTIDWKENALVTQKRFHDDAWVNYKNSNFGWLKNKNTLWYLSEETGFSHLYTKTLEGKSEQITRGEFEVIDPVLSKKADVFYVVHNQPHPGQYEIAKVTVADKAMNSLTNMGGKASFTLSPDESKLLIKFSTITRPPELYVAATDASATPKQLTHTISEEYLSYNWQSPAIVPVPSSHVKQPVFSKVYYPANVASGEKRRAVIFNHGAGYTQDVHKGWSYYFRETMFHNMLAQQGYVVMSMDYRGSMGYGRDWRTAIYRNMGTPEIEDLVDGVKWMTANMNVDPARVGTYGGSYGGFMTFMALFKEPEVFKAGAAIRPVTDWAHYNHPYTSNILNHPDVDAIAYERSSPIYFAEGLKGHLLINAPMVDDNVFFQDVVRLVQRMIELEKEDFETAIYPVEPHGFRQPSSWLDEYRRIYKLFEKNL